MRHDGFLAPEVRRTDLEGAPPDGGNICPEPGSIGPPAGLRQAVPGLPARPIFPLLRQLQQDAS
eukprot:135799-Amphidinium_carterae.1